MSERSQGVIGNETDRNMQRLDTVHWPQWDHREETNQSRNKRRFHHLGCSSPDLDQSRRAETFRHLFPTDRALKNHNGTRRDPQNLIGRLLVFGQGRRLCDRVISLFSVELESFVGPLSEVSSVHVTVHVLVVERRENAWRALS